MKIAIFSNTFVPQTNGVANVVFRTAQNLLKRGHQVIVFTVSKNNLEHVDGVPVFVIKSAPSFVYSGERVALPSKAFLGELKKFNPDLIYTHTLFGVGKKAVTGAKKLNIPLVGMHHTFYDHYLKHIWLDYSWAKKFSWKLTNDYYNKCHFIISPSRALLDTMSSNGLKPNSVVLSNSIDTDFFSPAKDEEVKKQIREKFGIKGPTVCYMGRISYEKSVDEVVKSFAILLKKNPDLQLVIIGDGPDKAKLCGLADKLGVREKIIFTGFLYKENLVDALRAVDVFVTASKSENMPLSVLEAMSVGLPVVAVKEKGLAEIVKHGVNGFFAKTDDPHDIAEKIIDIIGSSDILKKMSSDSRTESLKYSHENISEEMEKIFYQLIGNHKKI